MVNVTIYPEFETFSIAVVYSIVDDDFYNLYFLAKAENIFFDSYGKYDNTKCEASKFLCILNVKSYVSDKGVLQIITFPLFAWVISSALLLYTHYELLLARANWKVILSRENFDFAPISILIEVILIERHDLKNKKT